MNIAAFIGSYHLHAAVYLLVFLLTLFDAAIVVFGAMFLLVQGTLAPLPTAIALIAGVYGEQLAWYWIGRRLGKSEKLMGWLDRPARPFDRHLLGKPMRTLIISKFIYGLHRAMLVRSGMVRLRFKRYAAIAGVCTVIWLGLIGGLGLAFGASYEEAKEYLRYAEVIPLVLIIIYFVAEWRISKRLQKEL